MKKRMTRNALSWLVVLFLAPSWGFATYSPILQGLGGAGRSGVSNEALFANPASIALLTSSSSSFFYGKPSVADWNAGGRYFGLSAYDGQNELVKGGLGFLRVSRARIGSTGTQVYEDRSEYRLVLGRAIFSNVYAGLQTRYVTRRTGPESTSFFDGDIGAIFPVYQGLVGGMTYENVMNKAGEVPTTWGAGLSYGLGYGIQAYAEGHRLMKGPRAGEKGWALAAAIALGGDFVVRTGKFQEAHRGLKGWSLGGSWNGPRMSLDYAMRTTGSEPRERDHTFGISIVF